MVRTNRDVFVDNLYPQMVIAHIEHEHAIYKLITTNISLPINTHRRIHVPRNLLIVDQEHRVINNTFSRNFVEALNPLEIFYEENLSLSDYECFYATNIPVMKEYPDVHPWFFGHLSYDDNNCSIAKTHVRSLGARVLSTGITDKGVATNEYLIDIYYDDKHFTFIRGTVPISFQRHRRLGPPSVTVYPESLENNIYFDTIPFNKDQIYVIDLLSSRINREARVSNLYHDLCQQMGVKYINHIADEDLTQEIKELVATDGMIARINCMDACDRTSRLEQTIMVEYFGRSDTALRNMWLDLSNKISNAYTLTPFISPASSSRLKTSISRFTKQCTPAYSNLEKKYGLLHSIITE